jgi:hypothetical protein
MMDLRRKIDGRSIITEALVDNLENRDWLAF